MNITTGRPEDKDAAKHDPAAGPIVEAFLVNMYDLPPGTAESEDRATVFGFNTNTAGKRQAVVVGFSQAEAGGLLDAEVQRTPNAPLDVLTVRALLRQYFTLTRTLEQWDAVELVTCDAAAAEHNVERFAKYGDGYAVVVQPRPMSTPGSR